MRKYVFLGATVFTIIFTVAAIYFIMIQPANVKFPSPSDYPMQQADALMQVIAAYPTGPIPNNLPANVFLSEECWNVLQESMARNKNQFKLVVAGIYGDYGTPIPGGAGSDTVLIDVIFPDGSNVELDFYAGTLNRCQFKLSSHQDIIPRF